MIDRAISSAVVAPISTPDRRAHAGPLGVGEPERVEHGGAALVAGDEPDEADARRRGRPGSTPPRSDRGSTTSTAVAPAGLAGPSPSRQTGEAERLGERGHRVGDRRGADDARGAGLGAAARGRSPPPRRTGTGSPPCGRRATSGNGSSPSGRIAQQQGLAAGEHVERRRAHRALRALAADEALERSRRPAPARRHPGCAEVGHWARTTVACTKGTRAAISSAMRAATRPVPDALVTIDYRLRATERIRSAASPGPAWPPTPVTA